MVKVKRIICGTVNCYLLSSVDGAVLVDTGEKRYAEKVLQACQSENVRLLVLTHGHIDHVQNAAYLAKHLQIPVAMNKRDINLLQNQLSQKMVGEGILGRIMGAVSKRKMLNCEIAGFVPEIHLKAGDSLKDFGVQATVVELPGHTNGSIGLDVEERDIIVGDTLMNVLYPCMSCFYHNQDELKESAGWIQELGSRTVYFGHGSPVENRKWI